MEMVVHLTDEDFMADDEDKSSFVTVTHGMRGYFAVLMKWYPEDNMWDAWQTGIGSYKTAEGARLEARDWARAEELRVE